MPVNNLHIIEKSNYFVKIGWTADYYFGFEGVTTNSDGIYFLETIPPEFDIYKKGPTDPSFVLIESNYLGNNYTDENLDPCDTSYYIQNSKNNNDKTNTLVVSNSPTTFDITLAYRNVRGGKLLHWSVDTNLNFVENLFILNDEKLTFSFTDSPFEIYRKSCGEGSFTKIADVCTDNTYYQIMDENRTSHQFYVRTTICGTTYTSNTISIDNCDDVGAFILNTPYLEDDGLHLSWIDVYSDSYNIYRKQYPSGTYSIIHNTTDLSWVDNTLDRVNDYMYYIEAVHGCCPDLESNEKTFLSLCVKGITGFKIESSSVHGVYLRWDRPYDNCQFEIYRGTDSSGPWTSIATTYNSRYTDEPDPSYEKYYYYISTVGSYGGCTEIVSPILNTTIQCEYFMYVNKDDLYSSMEYLRFTWGGDFDVRVKSLFDSFLATKKEIILYNPQYDYSVQYTVYRRKKQPTWTDFALVDTLYGSEHQDTNVPINVLWEYQVRVNVTGCGELVVGKLEHNTGGPIPYGNTTLVNQSGLVVNDKRKYDINLKATYNPSQFSENVYVNWNHLPTDNPNQRSYLIQRRQKIPGGWSAWETVYAGSDNNTVDYIPDFTENQYKIIATYYNIWQYTYPYVTIESEQCPDYPTPIDWCFQYTKDFNGDTTIFWNSPDPKGDEYDVYWIYYVGDGDIILLGTADGANRSFNIGQLDYKKVYIEAITRNMCRFETSCQWPPEEPPVIPGPCDHTCPAPPSHWCYDIDEALKKLVWEQPVVGGTFKIKDENDDCIDVVRTFQYELRHMDLDLFFIITKEKYFNYGSLNAGDYGLNSINPERFYLKCTTNDGCEYSSDCEETPDPPCQDYNGCYDCDCCGHTEETWLEKNGGVDKPCTLSIPNPPDNVAVYYVYKDGVLVDTIYEPKYEIP